MKKHSSTKKHLLEKSMEAMLSAVQIYNNPLTSFKIESFIVLSIIAWTYLLHAFYKDKKIDYRYYNIKNKRKSFVRNSDGSIKYWDLKKCITGDQCKLDEATKNNLNFLIGLRNQIEHKNSLGLDSYLSARYQACALNFNYYLKKFNGDKYSLDKKLALSLQFSELDDSQSKIIKDKEKLIPKEILSYISKFDNNLSEAIVKNERFAYRLLFTKIVAKRKGQADRVIEFIDPKSNLSKNISKEYWVKEEREKEKLSATQVVQEIQKAGFKNFGMYQHTRFWQQHDGKNPKKGFGTTVVKYWYWYRNWIDFILSKLNNK
jgi:hypothetical protein